MGTLVMIGWSFVTCDVAKLGGIETDDEKSHNTAGYNPFTQDRGIYLEGVPRSPRPDAGITKISIRGKRQRSAIGRRLTGLRPQITTG